MIRFIFIQSFLLIILLFSSCGIGYSTVVDRHNIQHLTETSLPILKGQYHLQYTSGMFDRPGIGDYIEVFLGKKPSDYDLDKLEIQPISKRKIKLVFFRKDGSTDSATIRGSLREGYFVSRSYSGFEHFEYVFLGYHSKRFNFMVKGKTELVIEEHRGGIPLLLGVLPLYGATGFATMYFKRIAPKS